ncbi:hypothetical protein [Microbacterium rhizophilus]|uniref:hypothetical protein n=1 Tax=Microbacterium rhizophilus TaxID=3138934 RepID=UPI0031F059C1
MSMDESPEEIENSWWYNSRTGEVEHGPESPSIHRIGPFASAEEAKRAPAVIEARSKAWAEEEKREDSWGGTP